VIGSSLGALAGSTSLLLVSRLIEGIGMGLIAVVGPALIALWFPPERRGLPMGIWATWVSVGSLIIFNLAPPLNRMAGWQAAWWACSAFAFIALCLYGWIVPATTLRQPFDRLRAQAQGAVAEPAEAPPATALRQPLDNLRAQARGAVAELAEATPSTGSGDRPNLGKALANRNIWLLALAFACFNFIVIGVITTFFPTFLTTVRSYNLANASFITSFKMVTVICGAPLVGWLYDHAGSPRRLMLTGYLLLGVFMLLPFTVTGWLIPACMILLGIISAVIPTTTFAAVPEAIGSTHLVGIGMGVAMIGQNLGQLIGPVVFGWFVESVGWITAGYWMILVAGIGMISAWLIKMR
jgi:MFS family permease